MNDWNIDKHKSHDELLKIHAELESLTKLYLDFLLTSKTETATLATLFHTIFESIGDALIVFDKDDKMVLANRRAIGLTGVDVRHLTRSQFVSKYQFYDSDGTTQIPPEQMPHEVVRREGKRSEKEGLVKGEGLPVEGIWVRAHAAPVKDANGEFFGVVTIFHDISQRKRLQLERDLLASLITHDLKNHLASMISVFDLLIIKSGNIDIHQGEELLSELKKENERFLEIANTLMELYRMDFLSINTYRTEISLKEILTEAIKLAEQFASSHGIQISLKVTGEALTTKGIPAGLRQVFYNLLHNAIIASSTGQIIEVTGSKVGNKLIVKVKDEGKGMTKAELDRLVDPKHVITKLGESSSTGIGLYLTSRIIETHGGIMSCESELGKGTTFSIELPLS